MQADEHEPVDVATAREVGYQALLALERQEFSTAEAELSRALGLRPAPTFYEARGRARLALGKWLAAAQDFSAAIAFREQQHESEAFQRARASAKAALVDLEGKLPRLTLLAGAPVERVTVDGVPWSSAVLGVPRPVDPGSHSIEVYGAVGGPRRYTVELKPAEHHSLSIGPLLPAPDPIVQQPPVAKGPLVPRGARAAASPSRAAAYVVGASSIVLIASAVITGMVALERRSAFDEENEPEVSLARKQRLHRDATTWGWVNTGIWTAAIVASGVTAYLFVTATPSGGHYRAGLNLQLTAVGQF